MEPRSLGEGLLDIVELAVAVILFEGGLNLEFSRLVRSQTAIRRLVTWGVLITGVGATVVAHFLLDWPWLLASLFGSLVTVTGPTVIGPLVRELRLRPRVATVLEAEGVLIDPIGAILAVLVLEVALTPDADTLAIGGRAVLMQLGFGTFAGLFGGLCLAGLLRFRRIVPDGYENIVALASILLLFVASNVLVPQSGILAVPVAGVVVGNMRTRVDRDLREFKDQLSVLLIGLLFVLLAADVRIAEIEALGVPGALTVAVLVFVVRPLNVAICTAGSDLTVRERMLVAWVAPRGIVAAAVASISAVALDSHGLEGGDTLRAMVFMTIAGTVLLAGFTAKPLAHLLGVRLPERETVGILGIPGLGLLLGKALRDGGRSVVFLDANHEHCRLAEEEGFNVVYGNALQERSLQRARFELVGTAIGMTPNDSLNQQFAAYAAEYFGVPEGLAASRRDDEAGDFTGLFVQAHDLERWDVRIRHGMIEMESWKFVGKPEAADETNDEPDTGASSTTRLNERYVLLVAQRGKRAFPTSHDYKPKLDDQVLAVIHSQEREEAFADLRSLGWEPVPEESDDETTSNRESTSSPDSS
ncbi:MAG: sodium:proton antiporter [Deltaproteobacteria bacterium]|nr:sodium:proton antiporter [Deltaproteobacteria bacterium]